MDDPAQPTGTAPTERGGGLLSAVEELFGAVARGAGTRLELLFLELQQAFDGLASTLLWGLVALFAVGLGVLMGALALIFAFWDTHRVLVSLLVMAGFLATGAAAALLTLLRLRGQRQLFAATLAQLALDRDSFGPTSWTRPRQDRGTAADELAP